MSAIVFVDTNVLVYARDSTEVEKQRRAMDWMTWLWDARAGRLSMQVLQEYYVTVTRKLDPPRSLEDARDDVTALHAWRPATVDLDVMERAWSIQDRVGLSWWDALIVAAALNLRCTHLLTEDMQAGQRIEGLTIVNPFEHQPTSLSGEPNR